MATAHDFNDNGITTDHRPVDAQLVLNLDDGDIDPGAGDEGENRLDELEARLDDLVATDEQLRAEISALRRSEDEE